VETKKKTTKVVKKKVPAKKVVEIPAENNREYTLSASIDVLSTSATDSKFEYSSSFKAETVDPHESSHVATNETSNHSTLNNNNDSYTVAENGGKAPEQFLRDDTFLQQTAARPTRSISSASAFESEAAANRESPASSTEEKMRTASMHEESDPPLRPRKERVTEDEEKELLSRRESYGMPFVGLTERKKKRKKEKKNVAKLCLHLFRCCFKKTRLFLRVYLRSQEVK
jgi:hypothetical protein